MTAAVIPIKCLSKAKSRLGGVYTSEKRAALCLAMLEDMLHLFLQCSFLQGIFLVTPDELVADWCRQFYPQIIILRDEGSGLDAAVETAGKIVAAMGYDVMLFVHGDLPSATQAEMYSLAEEASRRQVVLVPDCAMTGTTAVALRPPQVIQTAFGPNSFQRHLNICRTALVDYATLCTAGLSQDVDTPQDLLSVPRLSGSGFARLAGA